MPISLFKSYKCLFLSSKKTINDDLEEAIDNVKTVIKASHFGVTQSIHEIVDQYEEEK